MFWSDVKFASNAQDKVQYDLLLEDAVEFADAEVVGGNYKPPKAHFVAVTCTHFSFRDRLVPLQPIALEHDESSGPFAECH